MKKMLVIFVVMTVAAPVCAEDVMKFAFSSSIAPLSWTENNKAQGLLIDIADEAVQKRMGIAVSHVAHPWQRCNHLVRKGSLDALITNGPLRKEWAQHGSESVLMFEQSVYAKADSPNLEQLKKVKTLEDLRPFLLLAHRGRK